MLWWPILLEVVSMKILMGIAYGQGVLQITCSQEDTLHISKELAAQIPEEDAVVAMFRRLLTLKHLLLAIVLILQLIITIRIMEAVHTLHKMADGADGVIVARRVVGEPRLVRVIILRHQMEEPTVLVLQVNLVTRNHAHRRRCIGGREMDGAIRVGKMMLIARWGIQLVRQIRPVAVLRVLSAFMAVRIQPRRTIILRQIQTTEVAVSA